MYGLRVQTDLGCVMLRHTDSNRPSYRQYDVKTCKLKTDLGSVTLRSKIHMYGLQAR